MDDLGFAALASRFVSLVRARWTLDILARLGPGGRRYQEIHDSLDGISYKMLTDTLRRAERDGLIARQLDSDRVETATLYQLTELGSSVLEQTAILATWTEGNWSTMEEARKRWDSSKRGRH